MAEDHYPGIIKEGRKEGRMGFPDTMPCMDEKERGHGKEWRGEERSAAGEWNEDY